MLSPIQFRPTFSALRHIKAEPAFEWKRPCINIELGPQNCILSGAIFCHPFGEFFQIGAAHTRLDLLQCRDQFFLRDSLYSTDLHRCNCKARHINMVMYCTDLHRRRQWRCFVVLLFGCFVVQIFFYIWSAKTWAKQRKLVQNEDFKAKCQMPKCQMLKCSNAQMPQMPDAQMVKCSNAQMPKCSNAQMP